LEIESIVGTYAKEATPQKIAHRISAREGRVQAVLPTGDVFHMVHLGRLVFTTDEDPSSRITFSIARGSEAVERLEVQGQVITFRQSR